MVFLFASSRCILKLYTCALNGRAFSQLLLGWIIIIVIIGSSGGRRNFQLYTYLLVWRIRGGCDDDQRDIVSYSQPECIRSIAHNITSRAVIIKLIRSDALFASTRREWTHTSSLVECCLCDENKFGLRKVTMLVSSWAGGCVLTRAPLSVQVLLSCFGRCLKFEYCRYQAICNDCMEQLNEKLATTNTKYIWLKKCRCITWVVLVSSGRRWLKKTFRCLVVTLIACCIIIVAVDGNYAQSHSALCLLIVCGRYCSCSCGRCCCCCWCWRCRCRKRHLL